MRKLFWLITCKKKNKKETSVTSIEEIAPPRRPMRRNQNEMNGEPENGMPKKVQFIEKFLIYFINILLMISKIGNEKWSFEKK